MPVIDKKKTSISPEKSLVVGIGIGLAVAGGGTHQISVSLLAPPTTTAFFEPMTNDAGEGALSHLIRLHRNPCFLHVRGFE